MDSAMSKLMCSGKTITTLQEKVDGANLGFSLSYSGQDILVQNRSRYIHSGDHPQYGLLTEWVHVHREVLLKILDAPSKRSSHHGWILFGEWLVARHSIAYHKLPGHFVAFDIESGRFVSQSRLHNLLQGSAIPVAPTLDHRAFEPGCDLEAELMALLETTSRFRVDNGPVEGIVLRIDEGDWLGHRTKLVRPEFVAGCSDGHWSKRKIEKQRIDPEFADSHLQECYGNIAFEKRVLTCKVETPRERVVVIYPAEGCQGKPYIRRLGTVREVSLNRHAVRMPRNLSWLWKDEVAVASTPKSADQIEAFQRAMGVRLVITLTEEEPLPVDWLACRNCFYSTPNYCPPTLQQVDDIGDDVVRTVITGGTVLEHCGGGKGRAVTVAACLLLRFGREGVRARIHSENTSSTQRIPACSADHCCRVYHS